MALIKGMAREGESRLRETSGSSPRAKRSLEESEKEERGANGEKSERYFFSRRNFAH